MPRHQLANGWSLHTPTTDFQRLVKRHAWRTKKATRRIVFLWLFRLVFTDPEGRSIHGFVDWFGYWLARIVHIGPLYGEPCTL